MNKKKNQNNGWDLSRLNKQNLSGGAYTLSAVLPTLLSFLFLLGVSLLGLTKEGYENEDWFLYASFLITPIAFLLIALFAFCKTEMKPKEFFCKGKGRYYWIALLLQFGLFSLSELNGMFVNVLHKWLGYEPSEIQLPNIYGWGLWGNLLVVALLPAVFEELFFRGLLLRGLKNYGTLFAVLTCGGLFALYHQNPAQTVYQFICGVLFALIALKAGSIIPTILSHFLNNATILLFYRFGLERFSTSFSIVFYSLSAVALLCSVCYLIIGDKREESKEKSKKKDFFLYALGGILIFAIVWIFNLFTGV